MPVEPETRGDGRQGIAGLHHISATPPRRFRCHRDDQALLRADQVGISISAGSPRSGRSATRPATPRCRTACRRISRCIVRRHRRSVSARVPLSPIRPFSPPSIVQPGSHAERRVSLNESFRARLASPCDERNGGEQMILVPLLLAQSTPAALTCRRPRSVAQRRRARSAERAGACPSRSTGPHSEMLARSPSCAGRRKTAASS